MRILIKFKPLADIQNPTNFHDLQILFYSFIKRIHPEIHNAIKYKYFNFSNIFPFKKDEPFKKDKVYSILFSSPDEHFIYNFLNILKRQKIGYINKTPIFIQKASILLNNIDEDIKTLTPIVVSIHKKHFKKYNIDSQRQYIYWNESLPLSAFINAITINLIQRYNIFYHANLDLDTQLFSSFTFKKFVTVPYKDIKIPATYWEFSIKKQDNITKRLIDFMYSSGLGEKNSAGFGCIAKK